MRSVMMLLQYKERRTNTSKQSLRLLMLQHHKNITAARYISEVVVFCCISQQSQPCHCSLPISPSFTRSIVRQPYEAILPAVELGNGKWDKIYNILQKGCEKNKQYSWAEVLLVTAVGRSVHVWVCCSVRKEMAVISVFNKSTETFFKNGNEKQLESKY